VSDEEAEVVGGGTEENTAAGEGTPSEAASRISEYMGGFLGASYAPDAISEAAGKEAFHDRFNHRMVSLGLRRQHNIEAIVSAAYEATETDAADLNDGEIDSDWMARFMSYAEQVGNTDMQPVWGYVLAREFAAPGSIGLPVLTCLANMTPSDIDLWERIGRITYGEGYVFKVGGRNQFERFNVARADIMQLQDLGLLQDAQDLSITFGAETKGLTFDFRGTQIILRHPENVLFTLPAYKLSSAGLKLFELLITAPVDENYLRAFGSELKPKGYDYRLRLADGSLVE